MRFKAYSVYLLFKFCFSLLFSMATVLSLVYHLEVVSLNAFQLVLVGQFWKHPVLYLKFLPA